jgi:hypothetical protein
MNGSTSIKILAAILFAASCAAQMAFVYPEAPAQSESLQAWRNDVVIDSGIEVDTVAKICPTILYAFPIPDWVASAKEIEQDDCYVQQFEHVVDGEWLPVEEEEFMAVTCMEHIDFDAKHEVVNIFPKPEWTHCEGHTVNSFGNSTTLPAGWVETSPW